jgi:hypothetical protein
MSHPKGGTQIDGVLQEGWHTRQAITGQSKLYKNFKICTISMITSRRIRWVKHVACMGRRKSHMKYWFDNLTGTDHLEDQGENGRVIFKLKLTEMGYKATE